MSHLKIWQVNFLSNIILKISNLAGFYQRQVVNCTDFVCASFLDYVADQKRQQVEMLQNITGIRKENILTESKTGSREQGDMMENLGNKGLDELFEYIKNLSVRDLKMYSILSNEDKVSRAVFLSLIDSEEAFMTQLDSGYLELLSNVRDKAQLTAACR